MKDKVGRVVTLLVSCCLLLLHVATASAAQHRSAWMWQKSSHPYGAANILGDAAKEAEVITKMGAWGFDRIYINTGTRSISTPEVVANWNASLDEVGIDVQFLISRFEAALEPDRTVLLDRIQTRLIDYNNSRADPHASISMPCISTSNRTRPTRGTMVIRRSNVANCKS